MAKSVIVLGAGASVHAGAPVTNNFMERARALALASQNPGFQRSFSVVNQAISDLQLVFAKSFLDLNNIESLFGAVEMARYIDRLGVKNGKEIEFIRDEFINLISYTLEYSMKHNGNSAGIPTPSSAYDALVSMIKNSTDDFSIISFNYDLGIDYALSYHKLNIDYGLFPSHSNGGFKLLKLHGSLNWGLCGCGKIDYFLLEELATTSQADSKTESWNRIPVKSLMQELQTQHVHSESLFAKGSTESKLGFKPAIIPPTWTKSEYYLPIKEIWKQAALELSRAENIYVAGYSLPESDSFFPYLYSLSTLESSTRINRFWVYNIDGSTPIKDRYGRLIGKGIEKNYSFHAMDFLQVPEHIFRT